MIGQKLITPIAEFISSYNAVEKDKIWEKQSQRFKTFWKERVESNENGGIEESECDEIIRFLDRNGKGNTKDSEAIAKVMVAQGAWRRMLNEFRANKKLGALVSKLLSESNPQRKIELIDELYKINYGHRNNLTGPSGNTICAYLAVYDPKRNLSVVSLNHRRALIEFLELSVPFDWDTASMGTKIVTTNQIIIDGLKSYGLEGSARTVSRFCYFPSVLALWRGDNTILLTDKSVSVSIPTATDSEEVNEADKESIRESMQIQAMIAKIGTSMGFSIWLPKADRGRVLKVWKPEPGELLDVLPVGFDISTMKTVEQIDVIWLKRRGIVRAFEIEHTTSVYSGLLRMADLVALQPNININLHIVAPSSRKEKVVQEMQRPVFSLLEGRPLSEICSYLSYESIKDIGESKHLAHLTDKVIEDYEEFAEA